MEDHLYFDAVEKLLENKNPNININGNIKDNINEKKELITIINNNCYNEKNKNNDNNYENSTREDETCILKNNSNKRYMNDKKKGEKEEKIKVNDEYEYRKENEKMNVKKMSEEDKTLQKRSSEPVEGNNNKKENNKTTNTLNEKNELYEISSYSESDNESVIYKKKMNDNNIEVSTEKSPYIENRINNIEEKKNEIKEKISKSQKESKTIYRNTNDDDNNDSKLMDQENSNIFNEEKKEHSNKNEKCNYDKDLELFSNSKENEQMRDPKEEEEGESDEDKYEDKNKKEKEEKRKKKKTNKKNNTSEERSSSNKTYEDNDDSFSEERNEKKRKRKSRNGRDHEKKMVEDSSSSSEYSSSSHDNSHNKRRRSYSSSETYSSDDDHYYRSRSSKRRKYSKYDKLKRKEKERERKREREKEKEKEKIKRERMRERIKRERERERIRREREREMEREKERMIREKKREERRLKKEMEEAKRDDLTVLVLNLSLKADERDIYEFFSEVAGKVRDIQCIKDQRSGKSKGVAYVEFYTQEAVIKALAANGFMLKNKPIKIQSSQAEKNRAAKAAKHQPIDPNDIPLKLYIGGLLGPLSNISEQELKQLFNPFGEILDVEIHRDPYTGKSKGFGFIQFHKASEAIEAMTVMNGMEVAGREIKVGYAQDSKYLLACDNTQESILQKQYMVKKVKNEEVEQDNEKIDNDDDDGGGLIAGAGSKIALMQKLQRDNIIDNNISNKYGPGANALMNKNSLVSNSPLSNVTSNLVLSNMFSPHDNSIGSDPDFFNDIIEDVKEECKKYGQVVKIWLDTKNIDGKIYIKYSNQEESLKAFQFLNGRYFGGSLINAYFITNAVWDATCL